MHIEQLITMANDIAAFFHGAAGRDEAARSVATHLRRYWEPRMRTQLVEYCESDAKGLSELAQAGVKLLHIERKN